jgi:hypothetical protein
MIHVYAVTDTAEPGVAVLGLAEKPVEVLAVDGLGVAVTRHESSSVPPSTDAILAHAEVCDVLQQAGCAVLPVRFGARYADEAALRDAVAERHSAFVTALAHVRGRVEIGVRVADTLQARASESQPAPAEPASSGAAYLQRRSAEERERAASKAAAQELADEIHEFLRGGAVDATVKVQATPGLVLSAAYLVPADDVGSFTARLAELETSHSDVQLLCTGPWPPYHFAGQEALA